MGACLVCGNARILYIIQNTCRYILQEYKAHGVDVCSCAHGMKPITSLFSLERLFS